MTRCRTRWICCAAIIAVGARAAAQQGLSGDKRPEFEVASVKRSSPDATPSGASIIGEVRSGGVWQARSATVYGLIRSLYPQHSRWGEIQGITGWAGTEFYDIDARATATATRDEMREMARSLLADRFRLRTHIETREVPAFMLRVARRDGRLGPGLTNPVIDCNAYREAQARNQTLPKDPTRKTFGDRLPCATVLMPVFESTRIVPGARVRISAGGATVESIVDLLSRELGRPVVDKTGLTQSFDIEVQYSVGGPSFNGEPGPPLKAALVDQLGLRAEDGRVRVEVLVVDHIERPDPD